MKKRLTAIILDIRNGLYEELDAETEVYVSALFAYFNITPPAWGNRMCDWDSINIYVFVDVLDICISLYLDETDENICAELVMYGESILQKKLSGDSVLYQILSLKNCSYLCELDANQFIDSIYGSLDMDMIEEYMYDYPEFYGSAFAHIIEMRRDKNAIRMGEAALKLFPYIKETNGDDYINCLMHVCESCYINGCYDRVQKYIGVLDSFREGEYYNSPQVFLYTDLISAQSIMAQDIINNKAAAYSILHKVEEHLCDIRDIGIRNMVKLEFYISASKLYLDGGETVLSEQYATDGYKLSKSSEEYLNYRLALLNNLILALYSQGMVDLCKQYVDEGVQLISKYNLEEAVGAEYILNTWIVLAEDEADENARRVVKGWLWKIKNVTIINYALICSSIKENITDKTLTVKDYTRVEQLLCDIENIATKESNSDMAMRCLEVHILFAAYTRDYENCRQLFDRMFQMEERLSSDMEGIYNFVCDEISLLRNILTRYELKDLLFMLVRQTPLRLLDTVRYQDENALLLRMTRISLLFRIIISLVYGGDIDCSNEELFEVIANSKNLYSDILAARRGIEQNDDNETYTRLVHVHRSLMDAELGKYFHHDTDSHYLNELRAEKHLLEQKLFRSIPDDSFCWKGYDELIAKLPDHTLYIDYVQYAKDYHGELPIKELNYCVMTLRREKNRIILKRLPCVNMLRVRQLFVSLDNRVRKNRAYAKQYNLFEAVYNNSVYKKLYFQLMAPAIKYNMELGRPQNIVISGDIELQSFPFDMLVDEDNDYLVNQYNINYVNSIRNMKGDLYLTDLDERSALVIGNPQFTVNKDCVNNHLNQLLAPLPLSKVESQTVADALCVKVVQRNAAKKDILKRVDSAILHIATHGAHLEKIKESHDKTISAYNLPLSKACIFLSGANDWIASGNIHPEYGTGIVTAEEICTYDWSGVKMIVMSACFTGSGDIHYSQGLLGMHTALLSHDIRVIITNLWEVDDFASAVLMTKFYENIKTMSVSNAFWNAKRYLMRVTVGELKSAGWFGEQRIRRIGLVADDMRSLSQLPDYTRLFDNPAYWAGFTLWF